MAKIEIVNVFTGQRLIREIKEDTEEKTEKEQSKKQTNPIYEHPMPKITIDKKGNLRQLPSIHQLNTLSDDIIKKELMNFMFEFETETIVSYIEDINCLKEKEKSPILEEFFSELKNDKRFKLRLFFEENKNKDKN